VLRTVKSETTPTRRTREFGSSVPNSETGQQPSDSSFSAKSSSGWPET